MPLIKSVPVRAARILIAGIPPRCRKIDRKHVQIGEFPENATTDEIRIKCVEKFNEERKGWKSVLNCHMMISPGTVETFQSDGEAPYEIKSVMMFDPSEVREQLAI
jgi:hypothetical protein